MKKVLSLISAVVILMSLTVVSFAQESEEALAFVSVPDVIYFDEEAESGGFTLTVTVPHIEAYDHCVVNIDFNTDIIKYDVSVYEPIAIYKTKIEATETGVSFYASFNESLGFERGEEYSWSGRCGCIVLGAGDINITATAEMYTLDGECVSVPARIEMGCDKVVNKSELDFVEFNDDFDFKYSPAYFDFGATAADVLSCVKTESAKILKTDGSQAENDELICNGSIIATLYDGFVVSSVNICVPYDVNCDGKLTAADARLALRSAASLEALDDICLKAADVDGKAGVTAADARLILRKTARL